MNWGRYFFWRASSALCLMVDGDFSSSALPLPRFLVAVKNKHVVSLELYQQNENVLVGVVGVVPEASAVVGTVG